MMKPLRLLLTLGLMVTSKSCGSDDGNETKTLADQIASRGKVLWIGAHPDDEAIIAPLLGDVCVERGDPCALLVATRGEAGPCELPEGCLPDLATVRTHEMQQAAALYGATLMQWSLPNGSKSTSLD